MIVGTFSQSEGTLLKEVFSNPFMGYSLSFLEKKLKLSYMTVFRGVKELEGRKFLVKKDIYGKPFRVLNFRDPVLLKMLEMNEIEERLKNLDSDPSLSSFATGMIEKLKVVFGEKFLILFIGVPERSLIKKPHLDALIVVSDSLSSDINPEISGDYDVSLTVVSLGDFLEGAENDFGSFQKIYSGMILVYGEGVFWKEIGEMAAKNYETIIQFEK